MCTSVYYSHSHNIAKYVLSKGAVVDRLLTTMCARGRMCWLL